MSDDLRHKEADRAAATQLTQAEFDSLTAHEIDILGTYEVITHLSLLKAILYADKFQWRDIPTNGGWAAVVTNSGSTDQGLDARLIVNSGASATSTASLKTGPTQGYVIGANGGSLDWSQPIAIIVLLTGGGVTNGISRLSLGKKTSDGIGDLAQKGIGIRVDNAAVKGQAHDGSSLATVDLSATIAANIVIKVLIYSDGAGNVTWYVDEDGTGLVSKGTTAAGPSAAATTNETVLQLEADNGGDASSQFFRVFDIKMLIKES